MADIILILVLIILIHQLAIFHALQQIKRLLKKKIGKYHIVFFSLTNLSHTKEGVITMLGLTKTQKCSIAIKAFDDSVPPVEAPIENIIFTSTDEAVCRVEQDPVDPKKATVFAVEDGVAQINVSADADLGEGEMPLTGVLSVEVQTVFGKSLGIEVGTPEEQ